MKVEEKILADNRYLDIYEVFETIFKKKGYNKDETFDKDVWFLKYDEEFQSRKRQSNTPGQQTGNIIHDMIMELSRDKNLNNFNVSVEKFIEKITLELLECEKVKSETELQKKDYNAEVVSNHIQVYLQEIERLRNITVEHVTSPCLSIAIDSVPQFARGKFKIKMILTELLSDGAESISENSLPLDLTKKDINSNDSSSNKNLDFEIVSINGITKYKKEGYHYSGINVNSFKFLIIDSEKNIIGESSEDFMLEIFLNNVDKFTDLSKNNIILPYRPCFTSSNKSNLTIDVKMAILFSINFQVRECILKQIHKIFTTLIASNKQERDKIEKILNYFPDYKPKIQSILEGKDVKDECLSCAKCNIF